MGNWYLTKLLEARPPKHGNAVTASGTDVTVFGEARLTEIKSLIAACRSRLAEIEFEYTQEKSAVDNLQAQCFCACKRLTTSMMN